VTRGWLLAVVWLFTGCTFLRSSREPLTPVTLLEDRRTCVLVLLPGLADQPQRFEAHGFHERVQQSRAPCDVVTVDSHFGYYRDAVLLERLAPSLLSLRERYERTWLVGVSLGGYGAALVAEARPDLVDGVVLISPFLGVERAVRPFVTRVESAGGLALYKGPYAARTTPRRHLMEVEPLWQWLAGRGHAVEGPRVVLAWGREDGFAYKHRVLAEVLAGRDVVTLDGGHTWDTFASLWTEVVAAAPWRGDDDQARGNP
jgi:pimeloyl-ACP methyl ester carboxylesterase